VTSRGLRAWVRRRSSRPITAWRLGSLTASFVLLNSMLLGVPSFGTLGPMRWVLLPNASCRYIANAPTNCWFYNLQAALTDGWNDGYLPALNFALVAVALTLVLGRGWCGWGCPLGFAQHLIGRFRARLGLRYRELPYWAVALLDHAKYAIMFVMVVVAVSIGLPSLGLAVYGDNLALPYCQVCPAKPLFTVLQLGVGLQPLATSLPFVAIFMLFVFLVGAFFVRMLWCRVCPIGAFMALFNRRALLWLRKDVSKCTKCRVCLRVCPMDIEEIFVEMERENVTAPECIMCGRCVEACPEAGCLSINLLGRQLARSRTPAEKRADRGPPGDPQTATEVDL
jgi:ferredoxin-type protein NapH